MIKFLKNNFSLKKANNLLKYLFVLDFLFIVIHVATCLLYFLGVIGKTGDFGQFGHLVLTQDESWAEVFQYLKYTFVLVILVKLIFTEKLYPYLSWFLLFFFFLLDDSLGFHETAGEYFVSEFNLKPMFGLRDVDFGELAFVAMAGGVILLSFLFAYFKGGSTFKKRTIDLFILIALMVFFGVGFDMLHEMLGENLKVGFVIGLIEDGGEMIIMSLIVWYTYHFTNSDKEKERYLFEMFVPEKYLSKLNLL